MIPTTTTEWLALLGNKWTLPVLHELSIGTRRFSQLKSAIPGVSQRMLAQSLRELAEAGIVNREAVSAAPPCVEYSITKFGATLAVPVDTFRDWATKAGSTAGAAPKSSSHMTNTSDMSCPPTKKPSRTKRRQVRETHG